MRSRNGSAGRNQSPATVALPYIWVIACGVGTIIPGLTGVSLAVVAVKGIVIPSVGIRIVTPSRRVTSAPGVSSVVPAMLPVCPRGHCEAVVQAGDTAVKSAAVETPFTPVRRCAGKIRPAENSRGKQRSCNVHYILPLPRPASAFAYGGSTSSTGRSRMPPGSRPTLCRLCASRTSGSISAEYT